MTEAAPVQTGEVESDSKADQGQNLVGAPNAEGFVTLTTSWGSIGLRAIEFPDGCWRGPHVMTLEHWLEAAELATRRIRRCRVASNAWMRHSAVMETAARLRNQALAPSPTGERPDLRLVR